jgi:hypothetical protein
MKALLFSILMIASSLHSQNMELLFSKYIPEIIKINQENYKQVLETLNRDAMLNPDLLYYRLNYYELRFNKNELDNSKNGFNIIRSLVSQEISKKNNWLNGQIVKVNGYTKRSDFVVDISAYFESQKSNIVIDSSFTFQTAGGDKNQIDFYSLVYLSENDDLFYDDKVNYETLNISAKELKSIELFNNYSQIKLDDQNFTDAYLKDQIIKYWFLFPLHDESIEIDAYEILIQNLENKYMSTKFDTFIILAGVRYYFLDEVSEFFIYPAEISEGVQISEVYNTVGFTAQAGYRFFLSDSYSILSYINMNINFSISTNAEVNEFDSTIYIKSEVRGLDYTSQYFVLEQPEVSTPKVTSIYLRTSIPIFMIGKGFSLEVGVMAGISYSSYEITYSYNYMSIRVDWDEQNGGYHNRLLANYSVDDRTESLSQTNFRIYPTVDINFLLINPIIFQLSTGYNLLELKAGLTF